MTVAISVILHLSRSLLALSTSTRSDKYWSVLCFETEKNTTNNYIFSIVCSLVFLILQILFNCSNRFFTVIDKMP